MEDVVEEFGKESLNSELEAGDEVDGILEPEEEVLGEEINKSLEKNEVPIDDPRTIPIPKSHLHTILEKMKGFELNFGGVLFQITFINKGKGRFSAEVVNPLSDKPTPEFLQAMKLLNKSEETAES